MRAKTGLLLLAVNSAGCCSAAEQLDLGRGSTHSDEQLHKLSRAVWDALPDMKGWARQPVYSAAESTQQQRL